MLVVKVLISVAVLLAAVEIAKRSPFWGAVVIALPLTSMLAMVWLYWDTRDIAQGERFRARYFLSGPAFVVVFPAICI